MFWLISPAILLSGIADHLSAKVKREHAHYKRNRYLDIVSWAGHPWEQMNYSCLKSLKYNLSLCLPLIALCPDCFHTEERTICGISVTLSGRDGLKTSLYCLYFLLAQKQTNKQTAWRRSLREKLIFLYLACYVRRIKPFHGVPNRFLWHVFNIIIQSTIRPFIDGRIILKWTCERLVWGRRLDWSGSG